MSHNSSDVSHYVVTAHPPGAVLLTAKCNFLSAHSTDVIVAKSRRLEVRQLKLESPQQHQHHEHEHDVVSSPFPVVLTVPINGRITSMIPFKHPLSPTSFLFLTTERLQYAVISYQADASPYNLVTHASGSLKGEDQAILGREAECAPIIAMDPFGRCIALHLYDGLLSFLPIHLGYIPPSFQKGDGSGTNKKSHFGTTAPPILRGRGALLGEPYHARIEERTILDMVFLRVSPDKFPQIALLHQDSRRFQHVVSHILDLKKRNLVLNGSPTVGETQLLKKSRVDGGSSLLIAVPSFGQPVATAAAAAAPSSSSPKQSPPQHHPATAPGGVLVLGQRQITYISHTQSKLVPIPSCLLIAYDELPPQVAGSGGGGTLRYLLGDEFGNLHMLSLTRDHATPTVSNLSLDTLGKSVISSSLTYLHDGLVYVASQFGDSQLVQIHEESIPIGDSTNIDDEEQHMATDTTFLSVVEEYTHLGPIVDFDLVPTHASSSSSSSALATAPTAATAPFSYAQSQVVTASGTSTSGSLRLVRNGIGMNEYASVEIPGIQNMWSVRKSWSNKEDAYLVQSFVGETRVLGVSATTSGSNNDGDNNTNNDDAMMDEGNQLSEDDNDNDEGGGTLEEVVLPGLDSSASTLYVGNVQVGDTVVQITESEIRLVDSTTLQCIDIWSPATDAEGTHNSNANEALDTNTGQVRFITVASATESGQIVLALRGGMLLYFTVSETTNGCKIVPVVRTKMEREISCIDLNPFTRGPGKVNDLFAMDVESADNTDHNKNYTKSAMVAVGLWDDFTVRLLSLDSNLEELLQINLSTDDEDEETEEASATARTNRNNMMARSLCLITLDNSTSSSASTAATVSASTGSSVNMLFVGLGDGTLVSFAVMAEESANHRAITVQSKKEVSLGTQRINLIPLYTERGGTCVLATGDRPTVIYLAGGGGSAVNFSNPKLCYSNVNLSTSDVEEDDINRPPAQQSIAVNAATPFSTSLLFDNTSTLGSKHYSLCVSDDSNLRLGVIDDIQKLHVTTCRLGMAPRRVVHCPEGRLFAVGCIESGMNNNIAKQQHGIVAGDSTNMGNCIRFLDDTTFEDIERIDLEPYEMILSMANANLSTLEPSIARSAEASSGVTGTSDAPASSALHLKPYLIVGTAYALPDEDEPTRGRILILSCSNDGLDDESGGGDAAVSASRTVRQVTELQVRGGVYSVCQFFDGRILASINSKTQLCQLTKDATGVPKLSTLGIGHHGHILSLAVKSRANCKSSLGDGVNVLPASTSIMDDTPTKKKMQSEEKEQEQIAIVGDLMRSISLVQYYPEHETLEEIARDFNANWTTAIEMLTDEVYLGAENWNNLFVVRRNAQSQSEEVRCRLDTVGEFHLGEMVNKFMGGSLVMPHSTGSSTSARRGIARRGAVSSPVKGARDGKGKTAATTRTRRPAVVVGSQTLFATVDGTIGSILGLDMRTAVFFSTLEKAMEKSIPPVGDLSHREFRAFDAEKRVHPSHGFVDGDLVESFLDLDRATMEAVILAMNHDGGWEVLDSGTAPGGSGHAGGDGVERSSRGNEVNDDEKLPTSSGVLTVEDVLAMVEEMTMIH